MGKKQALGSTPTFENVSKATLKNDLFTEEEIEEAKEKTLEANKEEEKKEVKPKETKEEIDLYNNPLLRERVEKARQERIKNYKPLDPKEQLKRFKEQIEETNIIEAEENEEDLEDHIAYSKPTNKQRLANGYIRATFEINEKQLELIKALTTFQGIKQKDLLEELIKRGLADISEEVKEDALKYYRHNDTPKKDNAIKDLFK